MQASFLKALLTKSVQNVILLGVGGRVKGKESARPAKLTVGDEERDYRKIRRMSLRR